LAPLGRQGWVVGTVLPESDFTRQIDANRDKLLVAVLVALLVVSLIAVVTSRILFVRPLRAIALQIADIANFDLTRVVPVRSRIREIAWLSTGIVQMSRGLASFQRYLPIDLVRSLLARGMVAELGGAKRTLTIMFIDLEGFTRMSERLGHRLVPQLGEFLDAMSNEIVGCSGTIDKYIGDSVMAFWGAPDYTDNHANDACRGALRCLERLEAIRAEWQQRGMPDFRAHIGLNTGRVVVGNIGSRERLNYTAIGDPVNLASRLESLNRTYGTGVIVGQSTYEHVRYEFVFRRLDTVVVRGRDEPVKIYELVAEADESASPEKFAWIETFEKGLALFDRQDWPAAAALFRRVVEMRGADAPSALFIERCERHMTLEPVRPVGNAKTFAAE
jgi:adenylate cyclase